MAAIAMICCRRVSFYEVLGGAAIIFGCFFFYTATTPGGFTKWSDWSKCSVKCGEGFQSRARSCTEPTPGIIGRNCIGPRIEKKICNERPCPQNGGYSDWGMYGDCDKSCGRGIRTRKRMCTKPLPLYGGRSCEHLGVAEETQTCNVQPCPVNGGYSDWGPYSGCQLEGGKACGKGQKFRVRICNKPVPQFGGKPCNGPYKETAYCEIPCPTLKPTNATISNATISHATVLATAKSP